MPLSEGITNAADYLAPATFKDDAPGNYGNDSYPYSRTVYESSPLDRVSDQYGPGQAWQSGAGLNPNRSLGFLSVVWQ